MGPRGLPRIYERRREGNLYAVFQPFGGRQPPACSDDCNETGEGKLLGFVSAGVVSGGAATLAEPQSAAAGALAPPVPLGRFTGLDVA